MQIEVEIQKHNGSAFDIQIMKKYSFNFISNAMRIVFNMKC